MAIEVQIAEQEKPLSVDVVSTPEIDNVCIMHNNTGQFTLGTWLYSQVIDISIYRSCVVEVMAVTLAGGDGSPIDVRVQAASNAKDNNNFYDIPTTTDFPTNPKVGVAAGAGTTVLYAFEIRCIYDIIRIGIKIATTYTSGYFQVSLKLKRF